MDGYLPTYAEQDDGFFEAVSFEVDHGGYLGCFSLRPRLPEMELLR